MSILSTRRVAVLTLALVAAGSALAQDYKVGTLQIEQPWTRATPGGAKVAGGFMKITNTGKESDRLIGGSADVAKVFEVHEMAMEGGMMKMRALEKGLEIKPGETIMLKPGSYHVMFIDLNRPIKEGETVSGELQFEKAGKIKLDFKAAPIGSGAPAAGGHGKHQH
jgi:periplasmic copper chaperone A